MTINGDNIEGPFVQDGTGRQIFIEGGTKGPEEWTEERLKHNYLKRTEEQRREEDERQRESGAVGTKIAAALGYGSEEEMSIRVAEVATERRRRKGVDIMLKGPPPTP